MPEIKAPWKDRIFTPLVTLWVFLGQVLTADQSCRAAVARLIAHRVSQGLRAVQLGDGGVLPGEEAPARAVLLRRGPPRGAEPGRAGRSAVALEGSPRLPVRRLDGLDARHAGEPAEYPLAYNQVPGTNFAIARIGAIISLSCGAILDLGICRYAGKGQGEVSLLRRLWDVLRPGDVLLGDRLMSGWVGMHLLKQRGVDTVSRLSAVRRADFRKGTRLGKDDHLVVWKKPTSIRSVDRATYNALPDSITVREVRFRVEQPGFRTRSIVVVTTLLDPEEATEEELAPLYRAGGTTKSAKQTDIPRCGLYPSPRPPHSGRGGAAATGPLVPGAPSRHRRAAAMRRDSERPVPPRPRAA